MEDLINKIHLGDCLDLMKQIPDKSINLVLTDPPYNFEAHGRGIAGKRKIYIEMANWTNVKNDWYSKEIMDEYVRITEFPNLFLFCGKKDLYNCLKYAVSNKLNYYILPMCKNNPIPTTNNTWLHNEFSVHICDRKLAYSKEYQDKIPYFIVGNNKETKHPNEKNINVIKRIIKNISQENDIVFDGFSGSGTTAIACHDLNRRFICIEKDKSYWELSNKRLNDYQNQLKLF